MTLIGKLSFVLIVDSLIPHISIRSRRIVGSSELGVGGGI